MKRRSHHTHTPSFCLQYYIFQDIVIATIELCEGGGVIIRGGRLPPRRAAPRLRSHRRRYCDANAVVATPVMPTPSMQRQRRHQCSAAAIVAATVASSSTRPRHGGTDLAPSRCHRHHDAIVAATTPSALGTPAPSYREARLPPSRSVGPVMVPSLSAGQTMPTVPTVPCLFCRNNIFGDILFAVGICVVIGLGVFLQLMFC